MLRPARLFLLLVAACVACGGEALLPLRWIDGAELRIEGILIAERRGQYTASNKVLNEIFDRLRRADPHLHRLAAKDLLGTDNDATVDGSHPTDLGFTRIADVMAPFLRQVLAGVEKPARQ